jgi:hypothetical protein
MSITLTSRQSRPPAGRKQPRFGPYSNLLRRGVIRNFVDGRSTLGRFARDLENQLIRHVGGSPSVTERLVIERLVACTIQLDLLDQKLRDGKWSELDARTHAGLINRHRLMARELGLQPAPPPTSSLRDITLSIRRQAEAAPEATE